MSISEILDKIVEVLKLYKTLFLFQFVFDIVTIAAFAYLLFR